ncbi:MAG: RsmD family RNA methyltransferase [Bacteroidota bacterium]
MFKTDFFKAIQKINQTYDIVFADPPYDLKEFESVPELILSRSILKPDGWFILEHPSHYRFHSLPGFFDLRYYGSVNFSFFKNPNP